MKTGKPILLITGGAGFIGSNLAAKIEETKQNDQYDLVICDRLRSNDKWKNIAKRTITDIIDPDHLSHFIENNAQKIEAIFHMGAISATTETDADLIYRNNVALTSTLWQWCAENDCRFIYASSAATYGNGENGFSDSYKTNYLKKLTPLNAYGWSKNHFDRLAIHSIDHGLKAPKQWVGLKFFNVYGPNEYHKNNMKSVICHIYDQILQNGECTLFRSHHPDYKDGEQMRDFIWVDDCAELALWFFNNPDKNGIFNVGTGKARSFKDLALAVFNAMDKDPSINYIDTPENIREKYQYFTQAELENLKNIGYNIPFTSLEDGVKKYVTDYLSNQDKYR